MHHDDLDVTDDLRDVASLLRQQRAELGGVELDRIKQRAMGLRSRSSTSPATRKSTFMRSRSVITALITSGIVMSGGSAALGVSALVTNDSASVAQYGAPVSPSSGPGTLAGTGTGPGSGSGSVSPSSQQGAANAAPQGSTSVAGASAQPVRQFAATTTRSGQLPFTGFAAIPVLLIGLVLLASGVFLRRGARRSPTQL